MKLFVLKYRNGKFVKRDDSIGPMSSGGYPYPVDKLSDATVWESQEAAEDYGRIEGFKDIRPEVWPLNMSTGTPIPIELVWTTCNHHCTHTPESTAPDALHYLDCPIILNKISH